jgi:hypothetical protein
MLPVIILSGLLALFLAVGGLMLFETWVEANGHEIEVPSWFNGEYDGGVFRGQGAWRLPDGTVISGFDSDPGAYAPVGVDPSRWVEQNVQKIAFGVVSADYPAWIATEVAVFSFFGLILVATTYTIVERRRPF